MMRILGEMLKLPLAAFIYTMEMMVKTLQGLQKFADQGLDTVITGTVRTPDDALEGTRDPDSNETAPIAKRAIGNNGETTQQEETEMSDVDDKDLSGDDLKLVRYKILFIKRDHEFAFPEREDLVSSDIDESGFTAWKIAEFIQRLDQTPIPDKWRSKGYPPGGGGGHIGRLPEDDKQYLRVFYQVLDRFAREEATYEADQIRVLEQIRDELARRPPAVAAAAAEPPPGGGTPGAGTEEGGGGAGRRDSLSRSRKL
jgi:hypothetical protein